MIPIRFFVAVVCWDLYMDVEPKIVGKKTQIIHLFIGFSIIFTMHLGVPLFLVQHPYIGKNVSLKGS